MKQLQLLLISTLFLIQAGAQKSIAFGIHGNAGNRAFDANGGYGAGISFLIPAGPDGAIRLYSGYDRFPKAVGLIGNDTDLPSSFLSWRAGYQRWLYSDNVFVYADAGVSTLFHQGSNSTGFSYAAGAGYKLNLPKSKLLQFTLSYQRSRIDDVSYAWLSLGAAYGIKFGTRKSFRRD